MNETMMDDADTWYRRAEQKAAHYLADLQEQVTDKSYGTVLTDDIRHWKKNPIHQSVLSFMARSARKPDSRHYDRYIQWLKYTGKLDDYLDRSVSYIYMRDLGQALDTPKTQQKIQRVVNDIKEKIIQSPKQGESGEQDELSLASLYRWAQKEGVEDAAIWVMSKLNMVSSRLPEELDGDHALRKLIKIIVGVVLHVADDLDEETDPAERSRRLDEAIRLGYSYGLTYPFIDDLLDCGLLDEQEKEQYSEMIRTSLLQGTVPEQCDWSGSSQELVRYVHGELREAFNYIKHYQKPERLQTFFEQSYVFFHAQDIDRRKVLTNPAYTNEELYLPIILKSSSSRLIVRTVLSAPEDEGFEQHTFYYGIYNQLADDFADVFDDMRDGAVTPYTYYLHYREQRPDLINPFELYWSVIAHLIHKVYHGDSKTRDVMLDRAINGLKRCKERIGLEKYSELMDILASGHPEFNRLMGQMVQRADDVDFYDKLLRDRLIEVLKRNREEKAAFHTTFASVRKEINQHLLITADTDLPPMKTSLIDAANYSLQGDGKRLRPVLAWVIGVQVYGLAPSSFMPLIRSLEYMHTASLIFDDLPSQDNASVRRGKPTLHQLHDSATAELTGLYLIQKAIQEQASLMDFDPKTVLTLMRYSSQKAGEMSIGQAMDLQFKGMALTLEQLRAVSYYKTGIAFEACLVMPAILAQESDGEMERLKDFAYHAGIAFQIKDDLLDAESDTLTLGKPAGQDSDNNISSFVAILGLDAARREMWEHYCQAADALSGMGRPSGFLKQLLHYMVSRNH
ncbi:polyprenyl synthetase family protein [Paenibacillus paeoniae]|uniref:Polyprenyl synthetase family protein n=1 Tax=Paenibacillus paeoniae TaxID=2292705 RepID=A0A371PL80_9BACL|nr:polyprenyl synthetase family protein [Paenibacillus paeoniae]REK76735.1 polyprenyl synthetase family protein [Paenibacillus paeoniae]